MVVILLSNWSIYQQKENPIVCIDNKPKDSCQDGSVKIMIHNEIYV